MIFTNIFFIFYLCALVSPLGIDARTLRDPFCGTFRETSSHRLSAADRANRILELRQRLAPKLDRNQLSCLADARS